MRHFNVNDYGECIFKDQSIVDNNFKIVSKDYEASNIETKYTKGHFNALYSIVDDSLYEIDAYVFEKGTSKSMEFHLITSSIISLSKLKAFIDKSYEVSKKGTNNYNLETICYTYENGNNKTENTFTVTINLGKNDIDILLDKNVKFILDGNNAYVYDENDNIISKYIIFDGGFTETKIFNDNMVNTLYNVDTGFIDVISDKSGKQYLVYDGNTYTINMTKDGLLESVELDDEVIHDAYREDIFDEHNNLDYTSVLHKFIYDEYNKELSFLDEQLYCIDRIDYQGYRDGKIITREIYRIDKDKLEEFKNILDDINDHIPEEPVL